MEADQKPQEEKQSTVQFKDLDLSPPLVQAVEKLGFASCTPIQSQAIPHILQGKDLAGLAQTGTGKTAAYLIPLIERILRAQEQAGDSDRPSFGEWHPRNFVLVLVPTRELAEQVGENFQSLAAFTSLRSVSIYGGVGYEHQKKGLAQGVEFIFATPGRFIDLYKEHLVDLKQVRAIVFDEADRMFDMGFKDDMKFILQRTNPERQFLMFSATLNLDVLNVAYQYGAQPVEVSLSRDEARAENVKDFVCHVRQQEKPGYLLSILKKEKPRQAIVFSNFKNSVSQIANFLQSNGWDALGISSLLSQSQRQKVMEKFKSDDSSYVLVATDVAARGLDIKGVDLVINFELPDDAENYVHRIGRTGRASAQGTAFSLVSDRDIEALGRIDEFLGEKVEVVWLEDSEIVSDFKPFPRREEPSRGPGGGYSRGGGPRSDRGPRASGPPRSAGPRSRQDSPRDRGPGQREDSRRDEPREQHRDRRMGRHGEKGSSRADIDRTELDAKGQSARGDGQRRGAGGSHSPRPDGGDQKRRSTRKRSSSSRRRPSNSRGSGAASSRQGASSRSSASKSEGFVGKVSKIFKKIFGKGKDSSSHPRSGR